MSCHEKRTYVHEVQTCAAPLLAGIGLAAMAVGVVLRALGRTSRNIIRKVSMACPMATTDTVRGLPGLTDQRLLLEQRVAERLRELKLSPAEMLKLKTLASLRSTPYLIGESAPLQQSVKALGSAGSLPEVEAARESLLALLELQHRGALEQTLSAACQRAAAQVGFGTVHMMSGPLGTIRVIAEDPAGHALVTEVDAGDSRRVPRIETEVVGVTDGSCMLIMDRFSRALEAAGVRSSPPTRTFTGGVCELEAAREFLRDNARPASLGTQRKEPKELAEVAVRRARQLNQPKLTNLTRRNK